MGFDPSTPAAGHTVGLRDEGSAVEGEQGRNKDEWVMVWLSSPLSLARARAHALSVPSRARSRTRALSRSLWHLSSESCWTMDRIVSRSLLVAPYPV